MPYSPRTKLTVRRKATSLIRPNTSTGTKHMFVSEGKLLETGGKKKHEKMVKKDLWSKISEYKEKIKKNLQH